MPSPVTLTIRPLVVAAGLLVAAARPETVARGDDTVMRIADVRALPAAVLATNPEIRIRGVVTRARESSLFVQDESAGIYVNIARAIIRGVMPRDGKQPEVALGSEIEITGVADPGSYSPLILPRTLAVLGPKPLPEPPPFDDDAFFEGVTDSLFVEATGLVEEAVEFGDHWRLSLDHHSRPFLASLVKTAVQGDPQELVNATVRVRGPTSSMCNTRGEFLLPWVFVERAEWIEVVTPRPQPPFESPKLPLERLARYHTAARRGAMVRTEATVIHVTSDALGQQVFLQDGPYGLRATSRSLAGLAVGDRVEVAGFIRRDGNVAGIAHAMFRRLSAGRPPEAFVITPERIEAINTDAVKASANAAPGDYDGCLIRFPARIVDFQEEEYWGTLVLSTGSTTVTAEAPPDTCAGLRKLPIASDVSVTGVARLAWDVDPLAWPNRRPRELSLLVRSIDDVALVRRPSPWTARRLGALLGVTLSALAATAAWGWSVRRRRALLEDMVRDRTRELAAAREHERQTEERARVTLQSKLKASLAAAAVAHEINQPLSRILLASRLELDGAGDGREVLRNIVADADRVVTTIEKMKVLLRNVETQHERIDLAQVVRSSLFQVKGLAAAAGVTIRQTSPPAGCPVNGDAVQLQLAVANLLRNALEALAAAGAVTREVDVVVGRTADRAVLTVGDSGPGWSGGSLDDALVASTKPQGAGVGLFVVRTTVENHGGTLTVGRSPLGGAEFRIELPDERRP